MTPQQLMDLPYAGMDEQYLKSTGDWAFSDIEKTVFALNKLKEAQYELQGAMDDMEQLTQ